jgi:hypothetical protein
MMSTATMTMRMAITTTGKDNDPNGLDYSSEDDNNNLKFDADLKEFELVDFADPNGEKKKADWRRYKDGPQPPDYSGMSDIEKKLAKGAYDIIRRKWIDQQRKLQLKSKAEVDLDWTGVRTSTLQMMKEVEDGTCLAVGQTFPSREIIMLWTAEEANLRRIYVTILKSSKYMFYSSGVGFYISATNSESSGWKISQCCTREGYIGVDVFAPDNAAASCRSPFCAKWLIPLIHSTIAKAPMASNMMLRAIMKPYAKADFLTNALLQVA